jgi:Arc/MetJ-type ribon-helix-helix transcriptional regulator
LPRSLTPEQEHRIADALRSGAYSSSDDVIDRALEMLHERDQWLAAHRQEINAKIRTGIAEPERGEGIPEEHFRNIWVRRVGGYDLPEK